MGVRIDPGGAAWSYTGFNDFRRDLAREEGIDLDDMTGFGGRDAWATSNGDPISPLVPLLNHSDCDGYLESYECELVEPRLTLILDRWAAVADGDVVRAYNIAQGRRLALGMRHCAEHGCAVVFG